MPCGPAEGEWFTRVDGAAGRWFNGHVSQLIDQRRPIQPTYRRTRMFHYLWMFIVGIVVGAIARLFMPGSESIGIFMTGILGIAGSFVGGFIARIFSKPADGSLVHPAGLILSVVGAMILLYAWTHMPK